MTPDATAERIRQQAADWAVRQRMERLDAQQMDALERWLDADPAHADALADAEMLWEMAETLRANPLFATPVPVARATRVRRFLRGLFTWEPRMPVRWAGVAGVLLVVMLAVNSRDTLAPLMADYRTGTGEVRTLTLADGSQVLLSSRSALDVDYDGHERRVRLIQGEALFSPAPRQGEEKRAFVVEASGGRTQALGTRFVVQRQDSDNAWVGVLQHSVNVSLQQPQSELTLSEGQAARYQRGQGIVALNDDPTQRADWAQGVLIFRNVPLDQVLQRFSDFRPGLLKLVASEQAHTPVSGLFHLDNLDAAIRTLAAERQLQVAQLAGVTVLY